MTTTVNPLEVWYRGQLAQRSDHGTSGWCRTLTPIAAAAAPSQRQAGLLAVHHSPRTSDHPYGIVHALPMPMVSPAREYASFAEALIMAGLHGWWDPADPDE